MTLQAEVIKEIKFGVFSEEQIKRMSVAKLTVPDTYNEDGYPIDGGLLDQRLGVVDPGLVCKTCGGRAKVCPGHFGHVEMVRPVVHAEFAKIIYMVLQATCQKCHRILLNDEQLTIFKKETGKELESDEPIQENGDAGDKHVEQAMLRKLKGVKKCPHCGTVQEKLKFSMPTYFYLGERRLKPDELKDMLIKVSDSDLAVLGIDPRVSRPESFILTTLLVPPVTTRPSITLETGERSEDDLTHKLVDIMRINQRLEQNINAGAPQIIIDDLWELLQYHITTYFNNETAGIPPARHRSGRALKTLAQRLKGKEGRFRYNLSGKRVNYSARTVISVEPAIDIDEVGVPRAIAEVMTVPFYVTEWNFEAAKALLDRKEYPMVLNVIAPDGKRKRVLEANKEELAKEVRPGYVLERQLQNGDMALFNRQPSLHRISIMAHRVRVLPGKTFRIAYPATFPYNADFDGDEMNLHIPQTLESQAEARHLMEVQYQIFSPRDGIVIMANGEDSIIAFFMLTQEGTRLSKEDASYLLSTAQIRGLPKQERDGTYSGRAIFSMLLPEDLTLEYGTGDKRVSIRKGQLIEGTIDKKAYGGGASNRLFATIAMQYGFDVLREFMAKSSRLSYAYATMIGISLGVKEYLGTESTLKSKEDTLAATHKRVAELIKQYKDKKLEPLLGLTLRQSLEQMIVVELDMARSRAIQELNKRVPKDNITMLMANSGARANVLNMEQMSMFLGQQTARDGSRVRRGYYSRRVIPHLKAGDSNADAHGFIESGFVDGLAPVELMMHAIAGRGSIMQKGLVTQRSGYLQRRLANALQDYYVASDKSVRDVGNNMVQTIYGGDGIDPTRVQMAKLEKEE